MIGFFNTDSIDTTRVRIPEIITTTPPTTARTPRFNWAHATGEEAPPSRLDELAVEAHWYERTVTLRLSCRGMDYRGHTAEISLLRGDYSEQAVAQSVSLAEVSDGSGRYVATVTLPLSGLENKSLDGVARVLDPDGKLVKTVYQHAHLRKPDWIYTKEGFSEEVLPPWTAAEAQEKPDGTVEVNVWGRRYVFGATLFPQKIESGARTFWQRR